MKILCSLLLCLLPLLSWAEETPLPGMIEKKRTIVKLFDVDANDILTVDNQFGQVTVGLWDRNEIKVQITISANSDSEERTQRYLDAVTIDEKRSGNQIVLRTNFSQSSTSNWSVNSWRSDGERNFVRINYDVMMPKRNALSVRNRFGNTIIPTFHAPLTVYNRYGNFNADELTNRQTDIDVAYGKAIIRALEAAKVDVAYGNLDLNRANVLTLINKFGKMHIGDVGKLDANIDYSGATIGNLRESGNIKLSFSGGFRIEQLAKTAENVAIQANYSSIALPIDNGNDCDFDVTVSYGNFNYINGSTVHFISQPNDAGNRVPRMTKQYVGKVGNGTGPKVKIISRFGNVNFR